MKERPIIMSTDSVRAILDGRKTQTRRVLKPQPKASDTRWTGERWEIYFGYPHGHDVPKCPYGQPGDVLWVKETWLADPPCDDTWDFYAFTDGETENISEIPDRYRNPDCVIYKASSSHDFKWRSPLFMPRWASRINLTVVERSIERLQNISVEDCIAEGVYPRCGCRTGEFYVDEHGCTDCYNTGFTIDGPPSENFKPHWNTINEKRGHGWDTNPLVWKIVFEVQG